MAARRYGLRDARLIPLRQEGLKEVLRVSSRTGGEFALRMYELPRHDIGASPDARFGIGAGLRSPRTLHSQLLWLSALRHDTDLLVPEPVAAPDGSLTTYVSSRDLPWHRRFLRGVSRGRREMYGPDHHGRSCTLLRWVPGRQKGNDLGPDDLALASAFFARLHDHAAGYPVPGDASLPRWDWHWPFGESAPVWHQGRDFYSPGEMEVFEAAARRVREDLEALGEGKDVLGPIHRDLKLANLVFHSGEVGAVDFDLCGLGHYLLDLSVMLISLHTHHGDRYDSMRAAFLEAYDADRPLPADHDRYLRTFSAMMAVSSTNRTLELLYSDPPRRAEHGPRYLRRRVKRIERLLGDG